MNHQAYLLSLGCPKNLVDSEVMAASLQEAGYTLTTDPQGAAVIVVNTCAFIPPAREEAITEILQMAQYKNTAKGCCKSLVVAGCLPQRYGRRLFQVLPEVDIFMGVGEVPLIGSFLKEFVSAGGRRYRVARGRPRFLMNASTPRLILTAPYLAYLKIADGCSNHCAYCPIPPIRGTARSRPLEDVLQEAQGLAARGVKELILVAQDTTAYGSDLYGRPFLEELLTGLASIADLRWIRLLYLYPTRITKGLLETMARHEKICPYIDMPIQHCDDVILARMNRRGNHRDIATVIHNARTILPEVALRTSVIVGLPGETPRRFEKLLTFVKEHRFDHLGAFTYAREEGTPAAAMGDRVSAREKDRRFRRIMEEQAVISAEINRSLVGTRQEVIIEGKSDLPEYTYVGRCRRQAPDIDGVTYVRGNGLSVGDFVTCRVVDAGYYDLFTEAYDEKTRTIV
ncbi:MAG: 30S ribosomal protein S12 methylthiotransferase RimO [Syntrophales bacterium]|nr:30S ribosomal protein S12 methylthiotransferase RimO [Syntrophales bacterium]